MSVINHKSRISKDVRCPLNQLNALSCIIYLERRHIGKQFDLTSSGCCADTCHLYATKVADTHKKPLNTLFFYYLGSSSVFRINKYCLSDRIYVNPSFIFKLQMLSKQGCSFHLIFSAFYKTYQL